MTLKRRSSLIRSILKGNSERLFLTVRLKIRARLIHGAVPAAALGRQSQRPESWPTRTLLHLFTMEQGSFI